MIDEKRVIIVLNKAYEVSQLVSALAHVSAGLGASLGRQDMSLVDYEDAQGLVYPNVSDWSIIVLRGGSGQMRTYWDALTTFRFPQVAYTQTMFTGGSVAQQEATRSTATQEIELVAIATLGTRGQLDHLTKKFSLWR